MDMVMKMKKVKIDKVYQRISCRALKIETKKIKVKSKKLQKNLKKFKRQIQVLKIKLKKRVNKKVE